MINQLLNPVLTQSTATMEEKVILTLEGTTIHSLNELREHFNRNEILSFYSDGRLLTWLCQHYYETQADRLRALDPADKNCFRNLCGIFDVNYPDHIQMSAEDRNILKAKEETLQKVLKDTGADQALLKKLDIIAINQEELASLIDADEPQIYLCSNSFSIPITKPGHEYIGIGDVQIDNPFTNEQYSKAGITVTNITLPVTKNPDTSLAASQAAAANGYDSFHESHSALATLFHNTLKANRIYEVYSLPFNASVMKKFYNSRSECAAAKKTALEKAYNTASAYVTPGNSKCIAKYAATYYGTYIQELFAPQIMDALQKLYELHRKSDCFRTFKDKITHSSKNLLELFQTELSDNTDYYAMYRFQYFLDQVEIEEHDYRVMEGGFWRSLETLISGSIQYTISDIHTPISEMEGDLNEHAHTFFKAAHDEYRSYCREIEELLQQLGDNFRAKADEEALTDYLNTLCSAAIQ
mgnify:FL=1